MFQQLERLVSDPILGLMAKYRADPFKHKVDLGVGVYRDLSGNTPILECVRRAEKEVLAAQTTKAYVGAAGREEFNAALEEIVLGVGHPVRKDRRARTLQCPGGCGALRVGAELIKAASPDAMVYLSDPTWGNHAPLLGGCGLKLERYPYYQPQAHELLFDAMLQRLQAASEGDVVLLHACCHNPTGADLDADQWQTLTQLLLRRKLVPYLDLAYQGFDASLDADAAPIRMIAERVPEALIAVSFSKNLGLYRERIGGLIVISENASRADAVQTHMQHIARSIYSMPPDHGAAIAARVFAEPYLRQQWLQELDVMRTRIHDMRSLLANRLRQATGGDSFDFIRAQHGMFSLLGVPPDAVERLREKHHIYMTSDSRMNLAGILPDNVTYVAEAFAAESAAC